MKTAKWSIFAMYVLSCVLSSQIAIGQYDQGIPKVFLPEPSTLNTISDFKNNLPVSTAPMPMLSQIFQETPVATAPTGCGYGTPQGCNGSCNDFGFLCDRGGPIGTGGRFFNVNVNRGPQAVEQNGRGDNRSLLQRFSPISVSIRSNHETRYLGFFGGYYDLEDIRSADRLLDFEDSFIVGFTRGRKFCGNLRLESEYAIRNADAENYFEGTAMGEDFFPTATFDARDGFFAASSMKNVLYDFNNFNAPFKPYVGLGLGGIAVTGDFINDSLGRADWINDTAFAYQFIIGATRRINRGSELFAEFRHFGTSGLDLENDAGDPESSFAFQNNTVIFGFRVNRN